MRALHSGALTVLALVNFGSGASGATAISLVNFRLPGPVLADAMTEQPTETRLPGWAYRIRTGESVRGVSDWNCVTTSPGVGASPAAESLRVPAA